MMTTQHNVQSSIQDCERTYSCLRVLKAMRSLRVEGYLKLQGFEVYRHFSEDELVIDHTTDSIIQCSQNQDAMCCRSAFLLNLESSKIDRALVGNSCCSAHVFQSHVNCSLGLISRINPI